VASRVKKGDKLERENSQLKVKEAEIKVRVKRRCIPNNLASKAQRAHPGTNKAAKKRPSKKINIEASSLFADAQEKRSKRKDGS